jgi:hypothetical protein
MANRSWHDFFSYFYLSSDYDCKINAMKKLISVALILLCSACNNKAKEEARIEAAKQAMLDSIATAEAAEARQQYVLDSINQVHEAELAAREQELKNARRSSSVTKNYYSNSTGSSNTASTPEERKRRLSHTTRGTLIGAGAGAVVGAATGAAVSKDRKGQGALIGAAVGVATGAATGAAIGSQKDKKESGR